MMQTTLDESHYECGHRMLSEYPLSKDSREIERLNLQYALLHEALGRDHQAPLRNPRWILDVGCGTGTWCRAMARRFERSAVMVGIDKDPGYNHHARQALKPGEMPNNYLFVRADALQPWPFAYDQFDYTHERLLAPAIPWPLRPAFHVEQVRVTRPGGWIECLEGGLPDCAGPSYQAITAALIKLSQQTLGGYNPGPDLAGWLKGAGLPNVQERIIQIGAGDPTDPRVARWQKMIAEDMTIGYSWSVKPTILRFGLMGKDELEKHLAQMREEFQELSITWTVHVVFGQKPRQIDG